MDKVIRAVLAKMKAQGTSTFRPVIISDIDGVLMRGPTPIPQTHQALLKVHSHNIPFACLTNGGGQPEERKSAKLNAAFGEQLFKEGRMFMNHSPLRPELRKFKNEGIIVVTGTLQIEDILNDMGITNYITADELFAVYFHNNHRVEKDDHIFHHRKHNEEEALARVHQRIGRKLSKNFEEEARNVSAVFALNDVSPYQTALEVFHNILKVHHQHSSIPMKFYASQNDIVWAGGYHRPRMAFGPFNYILKDHCLRHDFHLVEHIYYGKPQKKAFVFVEEEMRKQCGDGVFFMIGDNPRADIRGANNIGWLSFLTRTGIHTEKGNSESDPATMVVENFSEAIDMVLECKRELSG